MAIGVTDRGLVSNAASTPVNSADFTPASGSMVLVLVWLYSNPTLITGTVTDTFGDSGGTAWGGRKHQTIFAANAAYGFEVWYRTIGSGAASGHTILTPSGGADTNMQTLTVTGSANTVANYDETIADAASITATLSPTPTSTSLLVSMAGAASGGSGPTVPGGWTSVRSDAFDGDQYGAAYLNPASAVTSAQYTGLSTGQTNDGAVLAFEIAVAVGGIARDMAAKVPVSDYARVPDLRR